MSTYFECKNDDGDVAIDDLTSKMTLRRCGKLGVICTLSGSENVYTYATSFRNTVKYFLSYTLPLDDGESLIAIDPIKDNGVSYIALYFKLITTIFVIADTTCPYTISEIADKTNVYVFGDSENTTTNFGLQCFNENGTKVFDSNNTLAMIKGMVSVPTPNTNKNGFNGLDAGTFGDSDLLVPLSAGCCTYIGLPARGEETYLYYYSWYVENGRLKLFANHIFLTEITTRINTWIQKFVPYNVYEFGVGVGSTINKIYGLNYWQALIMSKHNLDDV